MAHGDDMRRPTPASPHSKRNSSGDLVADAASPPPAIPAAAAAAIAVAAATPAPAAASSGKRPQTLARRACDACRARRRKCIFADGPPPQAQSVARSLSQTHPPVQCRDCLRLGISCSFLVPTRTRGPKRRKRLPSTPRESGDEPLPEQSQPASEEPEWQFTPAPDQRNSAQPLVAVVDNSSPYVPSPSHASAEGNHHRMSPRSAEQHVSPSMAGPRFPTDELCSRALLHVILNDYLDLIYPLVPVIHRPTFRANLAADKDVEDSEFLALIIALAALTLGLLPSRYPFYQSMAPDVASRFKTRMAMINCCIDICMRQRTATYWDEVSQRKWAVCYVLSVGCVQTGQTNRSRMLEVEAMQIGRLLGFHNLKNYKGLNIIETQLRKKAFWLLFYCFAHAWHQTGRQERLTFLDHSMLHEVNFEDLFPLEVDDEQILENEILERPASTATSPSNSCAPPHSRQHLNLTSGFNLHSRVFYRSCQIPLSLGNCDWIHRQSPEARLAKLRQLLQEIRYMLDDAPSPMRQWASVGDNQAGPHPSHTLDGFPPRPAPDDWDPAEQEGETGDANAKALPGQVEIMRANLHGTHLWIQSSLLDQIDAILQEMVQRADTSPADNGAAMAALKASWTEREDVCRQMLHLLHSMPYAYLEPNGLYLTYKVRDIGVALLNCPYEAHERPARRAAEYMQDFTRALSRLDRSEIVNTSSLKSWVDTDREKIFPR